MTFLALSLPTDMNLLKQSNKVSYKKGTTKEIIHLKIEEEQSQVKLCPMYLREKIIPFSGAFCYLTFSLLILRLLLLLLFFGFYFSICILMRKIILEFAV